MTWYRVNIEDPITGELLLDNDQVFETEQEAAAYMAGIDAGIRTTDLQAICWTVEEPHEECCDRMLDRIVQLTE